MIIFEYVEFNRSRMFHDNWATENLRWRANLHNLGSNGRCADIPTHQGHVALCLVEARDGTDEWRITKNVLLNMIDLIYIFFDIVTNSEMIIINPRLWKRYSLTFRQKSDMLPVCVNSPILVPTLTGKPPGHGCGYSPGQSAPWKSGHLTGQWLHNGYF